MFRNSGLLEKMELMKNSRNSVELVSLAETALVHFEVSVVTQCHMVSHGVSVVTYITL